MGGRAPTLTLREVADLARVGRPVVSVWRKRSRVRGQDLPFPPSVQIEAGIERFDREAVVLWLRKTGRGNNPEFDLDAPTRSVPDGVAIDELVVWLCLAVMSGEELAETSSEERQALARTVDQHDQVLQREVLEAQPQSATLRFIDELLEASYGPAQALSTLDESRTARVASARDLTAEAVSIVASVAEACAIYLDPERVPLVHHGTATALSLTIAESLGPLVAMGDQREVRELRRRAAIRGMEVSVTLTRPNVRVLSLLGVDAGATLNAVDNCVVELGEGELAVILGPAPLLCDELKGEQELERAYTLRAKTLVAAFRLPRGLWREAPRQALGLWVCARGGYTDYPLVADLAGFAQAELDLDDLAADVTGALSTSRLGRSFRYLRQHDLSAILSARTPVVPRGLKAVRFSSADVERHTRAISAETLVTNEPVPVLDVLTEPAPAAIVLRRRSLGELKRLKQVRVFKGTRVDPDLGLPEGSVPVLSAEARQAVFLFDPFDAERHHGSAARTDPGDIVFTHRPRPLAWVDETGGGLAGYPSRILRIEPGAGIGPYAVAAIINRLPADVTDWEAWSVPVIDPEESERLEAALRAAALHEAALNRHLEANRNLVTAMIDGVAAGAVTLRSWTTN